MKRYAAAARSYRGVFSSLSSSIVAAWHGRRAGRQGLDIGEVADTAYLARLRFEAETDLAAISADLARELDATTEIEDQEPTLRRARHDASVRRARALAGLRVAEYELVCAAFGREWRRHHRDRHFAHLGWRCPPLDPGWR